MTIVPMMQYPNAKFHDVVVDEEALAIDIVYGQAHHRRVHRLTSTMRTPGNDRELCLGLLFSLGIIDFVEDVLDFVLCLRSKITGSTTITVHLAHHRKFQPLDFLSGHTRYSGCGVCGAHDLPSSSTNYSESDIMVSASLLMSLVDKINSCQPIFHSTGGCHNAALFNERAELYASYEDIGRHNALDKLIGHALLTAHDVNNDILVLTSRASFEIVQKAARAGIFVVVVMGAVSSMAVELALVHKITLVGFLRAGRFNVYTHPQRIQGI